MRHLVVVLGDQLNRDSSAFDGFDPQSDLVWMAEVEGESKYAWSHKMRTAIFLSAMRHFAQALAQEGIPVRYRKLDDLQNRGSLGAELESALAELKPDKLILVEPGEFRILDEFLQIGVRQGVELEVREDRHFFCSPKRFREWAGDRKQLRLEFFYRTMRVEHDVLMKGKLPLGGKWNYDPENRGSFGRQGPATLFQPCLFPPDQTTREVLDLVKARLPEHPGSCDDFDYAVTREQALRALEDFIRNRLPDFGKFQDAMWTGETLLFHSRLSSAMNLKLLDPREVVHAAEEAFKAGLVDLPSTEGFIRQILGWREYVRGVYWLLMPEYLERNALEADRKLPWFYWTAETDMRCMAEVLGQTLRFGYAHHIQRLMVTGLFAMLYGVRPQEVHLWYLAVYVDAVEWVELPNTLGMSQYGDGGIMGSKPYCASGKYIQRMSNYCANCRYDPAESTGEKACPFTTLYWDFLLKHEELLKQNQRMRMQLRNLERMSESQKLAIQAKAQETRARLQ